MNNEGTCMSHRTWADFSWGLHLLGGSLREEDVHQPLVGIQRCCFGEALSLLCTRSTCVRL